MPGEHWGVTQVALVLLSQRRGGAAGRLCVHWPSNACFPGSPPPGRGMLADAIGTWLSGQDGWICRPPVEVLSWQFRGRAEIPAKNPGVGLVVLHDFKPVLRDACTGPVSRISAYAERGPCCMFC